MSADKVSDGVVLHRSVVWDPTEVNQASHGSSDDTPPRGALTYEGDQSDRAEEETVRLGPIDDRIHIRTFTM